ncbi:MAG: ribonuclease R [Pseudomonadota bacterium]
MPNLPTKEDIVEWLTANPDAAGKRDLARAFGVKGADKITLKRMLRELQDDGQLDKKGRRFRPAGTLPNVAMLRITGLDPNGELLATPIEWAGDDPAPGVLVIPRRSDTALGAGDRLLAKIRPSGDDATPYQATPIKRIIPSAPRVLGIFRQTAQGGRLEPVDKTARHDWFVPRGATEGAEDGELVELEPGDRKRYGSQRGRVAVRHGNPAAPRQTSLIAMVQHGIPFVFSKEVEESAAAAAEIDELGRREDLRGLPLITIDPADARDHDDAVCAFPDEDPANSDGHIVWVAIADVAHYVRPGTALDREARARGNSTYFPDRVSPMLPERLSADLCSLIDGVDRPCMAVRMVLDAQGNKISHRFTRGLMRSHASLAYQTVQAAIDGQHDLDEPLLDGVVRPLYRAWKAVSNARDIRASLDLDLPERQIQLDPAGAVQSVDFRERLDAHRVIEDFMVLANVCAAETLEAKRSALLYRVHEEPSAEKLDALRETVEALGLTLAKGQVLKTAHFNRLLAGARGTEFAETVQISVLRTQTQAYYAPQNYGHFGLNLPRYAHFTSPIRRYADLVAHRALISAEKLGDDGLTSDEVTGLNETAEHISRTERRSMEAERDTVDRYLAAYLADRVGAEFNGIISGVSRAGAFIKLDETGADGLVPISTLGTDYFHHDRDRNRLTGEKTGRVLGLGMAVTVRLREVAPVAGGLILELLDVDGTRMGAPSRSGRSGNGRRKSSRDKIKRAKAARKARRR